MSMSTKAAPLRLAINGLGRIGRLVLRHAITRARDPGWVGTTRVGPPIEIVAANDLATPEQLAYLLEYDSVHRRWSEPVSVTDRGLRIGTSVLALHRVAAPAEIPWERVDLVLECTGQFSRRAELEGHRSRGVQGVVLGRPGDVDQTIVIGVNDESLDPRANLLSAASCTTNAVAPVLSVLDEAFGFRWGVLGTVHAQTASQRVVDGANQDFRRGRAAGSNIIPTTTGAGRAATAVLPGLAGKLGAHSVCVPVADGSLFDVTCTLQDAPGLDRVLDVLRRASEDPALRGVLDVRNAPLVSSDIIGDLHSSIVDEGACLAAGPITRIVGWYDNEAAYAARLLDLAALWGRRRTEAST